MKTEKNSYGEYEVVIPKGIAFWGWDKYIESENAMPSGRLLEGCRDHGYDQEYIGRGTVDGIPVVAIYLLDETDYNKDDDGNPDEDAGNWDWESAAKHGRLIVDVDELLSREYEAMVAGHEIKR